MNARLPSSGQTRVAALADPVPAVFLHCAIFLAAGRILGDAEFRLVAFDGEESSSELFDYQLELHGNTDEQDGGALEFVDLIGRPVTVGIQYPTLHEGAPVRGDIGFSNPEMAERFARAVRGGGNGADLVLFNGIVATFAMEQPGVYRIGMKPAMHKLSLTNNYRIHGQKNIRDAIAGLLDQYRVSYSMAALQDAQNPAVARIQDWLQAGESDLDFLRRLMAKAHLYFFFVHSGNGHRVVFANHPAYPPVFASGRPLRYTYTASGEGMAQCDVIFQYNYQRSLTSSSVRAVFTRQVACWEHDAITSAISYGAASRSEPGELPFNLYKIYQYGGSIAEVQRYTGASSATMQAAAHVFSGSSYCAQFRAGHQFSVSGAMAGDGGPARPALDGQRFVLTRVSHHANADGIYQNQFQATPAAALISGYSIQETQQGSILAEVVAPAGGPPQDWQYYTADYVDPEFSASTDRQSPPTAQDTLRAVGVYVRFSTAAPDSAPLWVKLAPHMQTAPEPGVTVAIARAQDESELPEIQSIVHSNGSTVVMPSGWTANTHVGSSYSTSYGDGTSVRFGLHSSADVARATALVDSAYRTKKYRETSYAQGASYSFARAEVLSGAASDPAELFGRYAPTDLLNASESFGSTFSRQQAQVSSNVSTVGTAYSKSTVGSSTAYSTTTGASYSETVHEGDITSLTTIHANSTNTSTQTGDAISHTTVEGLSSNTSSYAAMKSVSDHYGDLTQTTTHHAGARVASSTTVNGDSSNSSVITGINQSDSSHNVTVNTASTNLQTSLTTTLVNASVDIVGVSGRTTASAATAEVSVTGSHTSVQVVGNNNVIELLGPGLKVSNRPAQVGAETIDINVTMIVALQIYL